MKNIKESEPLFVISSLAPQFNIGSSSPAPDHHSPLMYSDLL